MTIWLSQEITNFKSELIKFDDNILNGNISTMLCCCIQSSDIVIYFRKKRALFLVKLTSLAFQYVVMNCASITSPLVLKTVAISSLVNMHLFFISGFYRPCSVSCSARQVFSFDQSKFDAGFLMKGQLRCSPTRSAQDSCISCVQTAWKPPSLRASHVSFTTGSLFNVGRLVFELLFLITA